MSQIKEIVRSAIDGVVLVHLNTYRDQRGSVTPFFELDELPTAGLLRDFQFQGAAVSRSHRGVVRGFHVAGYTKYIYVAYGKGHAAIMDCRPESPTFGLIVSFELDEDVTLIVPPGCGNAVQALKPMYYLYIKGGKWSREAEFEVSYKEFRWPLSTIIVSERDVKAKPFRTVFANEIKALRRSGKKRWLPPTPPEGPYQSVWV